MSKIKSFEDKVDYCRRELAPDLIDNSAISHALYLFENLLSVSAEKKESVRLVTGDLRADFYDKLEGKVKACIRSNVNVDILILNGDADLENNKIAELIQGYDHGTVTKVKSGYELSAQHMLLIGETGLRYRLETDHEQTKAVACFNGESMGNLLIGTFNRLKVLINKPDELLAMADAREEDKRQVTP